MNGLLLRHLGLPLIFLGVALLGGLRFAAADHALRFVAPPLTTLLLASATLVLLVRARLVDVGRDWPGPRAGRERVERADARNALRGDGAGLQRRPA